MDCVHKSIIYIYIHMDVFNNIYICIYICVSSNGVPQNHGFQCSNALIVDDLVYPYFRNLHIVVMSRYM